jgi:hypothetical protein
MTEDHIETRMATLIESIRSLSAITANHDILLTKLIDDHEQRIRLLEKCAIASEKIETVEQRVRDLENWRWYVIGIAVGLSQLLQS